MIDQQAPAMSNMLPEKEVALAQWRKKLLPYEKQLQKTYTRYRSVQNAVEDVSKKHRRLKKS